MDTQAPPICDRSSAFYTLLRCVIAQIAEAKKTNDRLKVINLQRALRKLGYIIPSPWNLNLDFQQQFEDANPTRFRSRYLEMLMRQAEERQEANEFTWKALQQRDHFPNEFANKSVMLTNKAEEAREANEITWKTLKKRERNVLSNK